MKLLKIDYNANNAPTQFAESLHEIGFAVLSHPPISQSLIQETYAEWENFFNSEQKHCYTFDPKIQAGYFPFQSEQAKGYDQPDLKEFFHLYGWSELPPEMSDRSWQLFDDLVKLAQELLSWVEEAFSEMQRQFTMPLSQMIQGSRETLLRPIHYPPLIQTESVGAIRAAAHEDINLITLLPAATAVGLEIQDNQANWYEVPSDRGELVVNVGDMLQMASQGYYRSTTHRVINPSSRDARTSRFSMPLFLHPRPEVVLAGTTTARSYLQERLREIGLLEKESSLHSDLS
jgi:isopenicillin N synthase-like dioxygenase